VSGVLRVRVEHPLGPNPALTALDEATGRLALADFTVPGARRYLLEWPHGADASGAARSELAERVLRTAVGTVHCVTGWANDTSGPLHIRHLGVSARLKKAGWSLVNEAGLGLGVREVTASTRIATLEEASQEGRGWFLTGGLWSEVERLASTPLRPTMLSFCATRRLAASEAFTKAVIQVGGGFAYVLNDDAHPPSLVIVAPESAPIQAILDTFDPSKKPT
jgi:hypothetical protein